MNEAVPCHPPLPSRIYRLHQLVGPTGITGLSQATLYRYIAAGRFPRPVCLGDRAVGWPLETIERWIASRIVKEVE